MDTPRKPLQGIGFAPPSSDKMNGALLVAACIIAVIRLRGEPIKPSPKLSSVIYDSVEMARLVLRYIERGA